MPRLLSTALQGEQERYKVVILVATSGDTGKAALEGFADAEGVSIFVFYPMKGSARCMPPDGHQRGEMSVVRRSSGI